MAFRFLRGFRREDAGGTTVQTADSPAADTIATAVAPAQAPVEASTVIEPPSELSTATGQSSAATPQQTVSVSPTTNAPGVGSTPESSAPAPEPISGSSSSPVQKNFAPEMTPHVQAEVAAGLVTDHARAEATDWALEEKLASHKEWVDSQGLSGRMADLSCAGLEGADLVGINLRYADFHDANLKGADLLLADLRDACMMRVNLEESCLVGANLEGANLESADLETAMGLVPRQLAGANLRAASLPQQIQEFPALENFNRASRTGIWLFGATAILNFLSWLLIWKTKDAQLVADSSVLPFFHSPSASAALPIAEFYLIAPALLLIVYLIFQFHLQRLWDAVLELPAVFPDGRILGDKGPWIVTGLLRAHFRWMNQDAPSTRLIEKTISVLLAYWLVPATLVLFWGRYLTRQEMHGTALHVLFTLAAVAVAAYSTTKIGRPEQAWAVNGKRVYPAFREWKIFSPTFISFALGILLALLSVGTLAGVPHDQSRAPQFSSTDIRRWASTVFWAIGYDPYADLTEAAISEKPSNWTGSDDQLASVVGAHLNNANFHYAQAYGAFLANSRLWRADFRGAFLSEADLRGADLGQANLRLAILDRAQLTHANLDRAELDGANLTRADLRGVNLSYSSLEGTTLVDARLDGASLYSASLDRATLIRASLEKADLRDSHLEGANLEHADMQQTYLWSARLSGARLAFAQLSSAIFIDAGLRSIDFHGAQFQGTVLTNADMQDTNLDDADMRGALSLRPAQICSAKSRRGTLLDDTLQSQVDALCPNPH
jgi:uncharacterized protein YjbI with pentapeptide repeats